MIFWSSTTQASHISRGSLYTWWWYSAHLNWFVESCEILGILLSSGMQTGEHPPCWGRVFRCCLYMLLVCESSRLTSSCDSREPMWSSLFLSCSACLSFNSAISVWCRYSWTRHTEFNRLNRNSHILAFTNHIMTSGRRIRLKKSSWKWRWKSWAVSRQDYHNRIAISLEQLSIFDHGTGFGMMLHHPFAKESKWWYECTVETQAHGTLIIVESQVQENKIRPAQVNQGYIASSDVSAFGILDLLLPLANSSSTSFCLNPTNKKPSNMTYM